MDLKLSISTKIIGILVSISFIFFSLLGYLELREKYDVYLTSYQDVAKTLSLALDASISDKTNLSESYLSPTIQKYLWLYTDIRDIRVNLSQDRKLTTIASYEKNVTVTPDPLNLVVLDSNTSTSKIIDSPHGKILRVVNPIHLSGQVLGTYQIDMSMQNINSILSEQIARSLFISLITANLFIVILYIFINKIVITPLNTINTGINEVSKGNFDYKIKLNTADEFADAANTFNLMAQDLKVSHTELKKHQDELETLVTNRTALLNEKICQLEKTNTLMVGREMKMIEMKSKIEKMEHEMGEKNGS